MGSPTEIFASFSNFVRRQSRTIAFVTLLMTALGSVRGHRIAELHRSSDHNHRCPEGPVIRATANHSRCLDQFHNSSQVQILNSENLALPVIKELHLTEDPEFVGPTRGLVPALTRLAADVFGIKDRPRSDFELTRQAVKSFKRRLHVKRVGLTYVIEINFRSLNPERSAQIANAVADAYVADQLAAKYQATRRAGSWLQDRMRELRVRATTAQRAVVDFKTKNNIVNIGPETEGRFI